MYQSSTDSTIKAVNNAADIALHTLESLKNGTLIWAQMLMSLEELVTGMGGATGILQNIKDFSAEFVAGGKDLFAKLENISEILIHPVTAAMGGVIPHADTTHRERLEAEIEARKTAKTTQDTNKAVIKTNDQVKADTDAIIAAKTKEREEDKTKRYAARTATPSEAAPVTVIPNAMKEGADKAKSDKAESLMNNQLDQSVVTNNKIDEQLKQMTNSNEFLKIIADTNPKLVELAEKQLAVSTMTQEQKDRAASRLRSENAKFSTDYAYSL